MKKLPIDWGDLEMAFDNSFFEFSYYLDKVTGQVLTVTEEARRQLEQIYEEYHEPDNPQLFNLAAALSQVDLPDWQKNDIITAQLVEYQYGDRIIAIPNRPTYEAYNEMQDFIYTIANDPLQERLLYATRGRGAFGRFKAILAQFPAEQERWYAFQERQGRKRILDWLESVGIVSVEIPEEAGMNRVIEERLALRHRLLDEVLLFVQAAGRIPGILRIALIGSLATDKIDPKDADLLVSVTGDADLTPLATLGRKLRGHAQSFNRGGEVFLADPDHRYLGRTCPWKRCGPGIRASCGALHCGRRPFLHDELEDIKLSNDIIAEPPLELWPDVVRRVLLPDDVEERVIRPLLANS